MAEIVNHTVPAAACRPHPRNYQQHDEGQVADLRESLRVFGQVRSIVVQEDGAGGYLIVAGHGVAEAARLEGLRELRADVIPASWGPARVLAYLGTDNELARRGMPDEAQLAALVADVEEEAGREMARLAAGGELQHDLLSLQQELALALQEQLGQGPGGGAWGGIDKVKGGQAIKPVLYPAEVERFERALERTGEPHRGKALMILVDHYLGQDGASGEAG